MKYPSIKKQLWSRSEAEDQSAAHGHLWNPSYYIETIVSISEDTIKKYIGQCIISCVNSYGKMDAPRIK